MEQVLMLIDYINRTSKVQRQLGKKPNRAAGDFPSKMLTKQEIGLKTPSSYRTIPDYVFESILEERKVYEKNRRRRSGTFQGLDYICCSTYGHPRSKDFMGVTPNVSQLESDLETAIINNLQKSHTSPQATSRRQSPSW